ncbi:MAG: radical SAM protein [Deltaproteobacteria bacterium]|nr:radical SAM protein [Deltaproteobacteria bacterium]
MPIRKIYIADLTHTAQGISASTFPLGASFVLAYARSQLDPHFELRLFRFPADLDKALRTDPPALLAMSNYSWNFELAYTIARLAKAHQPGLITVFGGPNFPTADDEKIEFLQQRSAIDFYVELEGELGFVDLVRRLDDVGFSASRLKAKRERVLNTSWVDRDDLVSGPIERIRDINLIPSPYLTGVLDEFFQHPLVPMIETTRGCPFSCTFCADGLATKSKITRFAPERVRDELRYVAQQVRNVDELIITDLNFAMYPEDLETARVVAEVKAESGWPVLVSASAGKNKPHRTIEVASILKGAWTLGASIQSTSPDVLVAIKRKNISSAAYKELIDYGSTLESSKTHSEIILGLPGDTKERHFESLRFGVENGVTAMRMFQAMLLRGTEMADRPTRALYGLVTRFRTIPGCVGMYDLFGERRPISEIEEIIIGSKSLSFEDYLECRVMNLLVETFYNNALMDELFSLCRSFSVSVFDCLLYIKNNPQIYSIEIQRIIDEFKVQTQSDLYETFAQAQEYVLTPEIVDRYVGGELGINELLVHKALLFTRFEDICALAFAAVRAVLQERQLLTGAVGSYLDELFVYMTMRKKDCVVDTEAVHSAHFHYDFEAVSKARFRVDPNLLLRTDIQMVFFHTAKQKEHVSRQLNLYKNTPIGLGRLIQRSNLKLIYRSVGVGVDDAHHEAAA